MRAGVTCPDHDGVMTAHEVREAADNEVFLRGRLAADPSVRTLPSGAELWSFRLTVARPPEDSVRVDSIDCATFDGRVRRCLQRAEVGDVLEVTGRLHRRFWRSEAGLGSRYEVVVATARQLKRRRSAA